MATEQIHYFINKNNKYNCPEYTSLEDAALNSAEDRSAPKSM